MGTRSVGSVGNWEFGILGGDLGVLASLVVQVAKVWD